jgi:hypothetical protein
MDTREFVQHKFVEAHGVVYERAEALCILRPAVARDERRRLAVRSVAEGWVHDCAQRRIGVSLATDDVERRAVSVRASRPPRAVKLHADLDRVTVIEFTERVGLHGRKPGVVEVECA